MTLAALLTLLTAHAAPATCYTAQDVRDAQCRERCRAELHDDGLWIRGACYCSLAPIRLDPPARARKPRPVETDGPY